MSAACVIVKQELLVADVGRNYKAARKYVSVESGLFTNMPTNFSNLTIQIMH